MTELVSQPLSVENKVLTHELQLGEQLNQCVHSKRRSDFSLMLAMLAEDVRQQSQFILPKHEQEQPEVTTETLRKEFQLPKQAPLALDSMADIDQMAHAERVANNQLADVHLLDALKPQALAFRDNAKHINSQVLNNTSIHCQQRHQAVQQQAEQEQPARLPFNAKEWLSNIQTTLVKQPLVNAYS